MKIKYTLRIIAFIFLFASCSSDITFNKSVLLKDYPSGSGMVYLDNRIYLIGDDANSLLILDTTFNIVDSIML